MAESHSDWTVLKMLEWATSFFESKAISNARFSIEWLLAYVLKVKRLDLYLMYDRPLSAEELETLRPLVKRRAHHEPLQYIIGETDFFGYPFKVAPGVLIPRPETEQLVELVLEENKKNTDLTVIDIGTGSGCIPITLKKERSDWAVTATDISGDALAIAKKNAEVLQAEVNFILNDLFYPSTEVTGLTVDVLISNPPYILNEEKASLDIEVKDFEPELALFCESTHKIYSALKNLAEQILAVNGKIYLEINERFGDEVLSLFKPPFWDAELIVDYAGKHRYIRGIFHGKKSDF